MRFSAVCIPAVPKNHSLDLHVRQLLKGGRGGGEGSKGGVRRRTSAGVVCV